MRWLLWKEYRHNRPIVYFVLFLLLAPHAWALYLSLGGPWPGGDERYARIGQWAENFRGASIMSFVLGQVTFAIIGGNIIAGERADRSSEFQFSLPITRRKLLTSKLLLVGLLAAAVWANVLVICVLERGFLYPIAWVRSFAVFGDFIESVLATSLVFFCVGWMLSSLTASPALSIVGGLIAPLCIWGALCSATFLAQASDSYWTNFYAHTQFWYRTISLAISPPCFIAGTWYFLRRVEP
jgi:ABC-type transport system involved in multi-copper enzyme maturation permease subunit